MRVYGVIIAAVVTGCCVVAAYAQTAETVGKLVARQPVTVMSEGLEVPVRAGQDYIVFSGDQIQSGAGQQASALEIPQVGSVEVGENTVLTVERSGDAYDLLVAQGEVRFELLPDADVFLVSGEEGAGLAGGAGQGGVSVATAGRGGYLVAADGSGNVAVSYLATGEVVYRGEGTAMFRLASNRIGAAAVAGGQSAAGSVAGGSGAGVGGAATSGAGAAGAGAAGAGAAGAGAAGVGLSAALIPPAAAAAVGGSAAFNRSRSDAVQIIGTAGDDDAPVSPTGPSPAQ